MKQKKRWYFFALLFLVGMPLILTHGIRANSTTVSVTPNQTKRTVAVTVTDANLKGKDISVICYAPGVKGAYNDLTANKKYLLYMNQYTAKETTTFSFNVKKQLVEGLYTLVVSSEKGQVVKQFRFIPEEAKPTPTEDSKSPQNTPKPTEEPSKTQGSSDISKGNNSSFGSNKTVITQGKKLAAPTKVKAKSTAKKKIMVTWKKVKGAKGYQISTATKKNGKYKIKATVKGGSKKSVTLKKMKSGKVYYVKVRAYQLSGKKKITGKYCKAMKVKVR